MSGDDILKNCIQLGLSAVEWRTGPVEAFLGVPPELIGSQKGNERSASAARVDKLREWRKKAFSLAKLNGANVDIGHFVAGNNMSPVPFLQEHHDRVTHVHLKDRKFNNGPNTPFGEGDTPIAEVLRLIRDNKWNIQATIEFEYKVPASSDRMTELARAIQFCRDALA